MTGVGLAEAGRVPRLALVQLAVAVMVLGAAWPVTKVALLQGASPSWFAFGRAAMSMVVAGGVVAATRGLRVPGRADWPAVLAIGGLQLGAFFAFAHAAVAWVPAGRTAILSNATLIWAVPIALLLTGEAISARRWVATALGAAGVVALVGPWAVDWTSGPALVGNGFLLGASLSWAVSMAIVRRYPARQSMFRLLPWTFAVAAAMLLPMALIQAGGLHGGGVWTRTSLVCIGLIGLVMAPIGTWCIVEATRALPLIVASVGFLAGPAVGLLISAAFLGEELTASVLLGTALILGGAALAAGSAGR